FSVDNTAILFRYTLHGDSNLDGGVNLTDFTYLAANFNGTNKNWVQGDYNYDGNVNLTDFTFLASNFNQNLPAAAAPPVVQPLALPAAASTTPLAPGSLWSDQILSVGDGAGAVASMLSDGG